MNEYLAVIEGQDYEFPVRAEDENDARSTAIEYLELIDMKEWIDHLVIKAQE